MQTGESGGILAIIGSALGGFLGLSVMGVGLSQISHPVGVALAGALLGFLCYNFPPATVFLGGFRI